MLRRTPDDKQVGVPADPLALPRDRRTDQSNATDRATLGLEDDLTLNLGRQVATDPKRTSTATGRPGLFKEGPAAAADRRRLDRPQHSLPAGRNRVAGLLLLGGERTRPAAAWACAGGAGAVQGGRVLSLQPLPAAHGRPLARYRGAAAAGAGRLPLAAGDSGAAVDGLAGDRAGDPLLRLPRSIASTPDAGRELELGEGDLGPHAGAAGQEARPVAARRLARYRGRCRHLVVAPSRGERGGGHTGRLDGGGGQWPGGVGRLRIGRRWRGRGRCHRAARRSDRARLLRPKPTADRCCPNSTCTCRSWDRDNGYAA